jgi:hypothetical protein
MQKGDLEKSPLYNLIFSVRQALENVSKLKAQAFRIVLRQVVI